MSSQVKTIFSPFMIVAFALAGWSASSRAQVNRATGVKENRALVYHGKLVRPDGTVPEGSLSVTVRILSPDPKLCVLWKETQTIQVDKGAFAMEIGHALNRVGGAVTDFRTAFINNPSAAPLAASCADGSTSYVPGASDDRLLSAAFADGATVVEVAGLPIKSVPFALQAEEIGGFGLANLMKISGTGNNATFSPAQVDELRALSDTAQAFDAKTRLVKNVGAPVDPADATTKTYVDNAITAAVVAAGAGTVTNVGVGGLPLSVTSASSTPVISIAQANTTTAGYLSAADWNTFNGKQPAGSYLTSITSGNVTTALGFTPVSNALATGQVYLGVAGVATASNFGIGQMRNSVGTLQFPSACAASQTLTWSAVTDVLVCANIDGLNADKITAGTLAVARLGSGTPDATKYLRGDGSWQTLPSGADNLGNHTATTNLNLASFQLVGHGGTSGIAISSGGNVGIGTSSPVSPLQVEGIARFTAGAFGLAISNGSTIATTNHLSLSAGASYLSLGAPSNNISYRAGVAHLFQNGDASMEWARISSAGNLGIGTASPTEKLEVVGGKIKSPEFCIGAACITSWPSAGGTGTVTNVAVGGLPLSVTNGSSTPTLSIAQANTTTAGYLSASDWNTFNGKQTATLATNQVWVGNGSNVAAAQYFGLGQLRSTATGNAQFPSACAANQTMVWSAITDVLACTNIAIASGAVSGLGALATKSNVDLSTTDVTGSLPIAKIANTGSTTNFLRADGSWAAVPSSADNLGNHTATQNLNLATYQLVGGGGSSGISVTNSGNVGVGTNSPSVLMHVAGGNLRVDRGTATSGTLRSMVLAGARNNNSGDFAQIDLVNYDSDSAATEYVGARVAGLNEGNTANNGALVLSTAANQSLSERMRIDSSGNVGIGTTSPAAPLNVAGRVLVGGNTPITVSGEPALLQIQKAGLADMIDVIRYNNSTTGPAVQLSKSRSATLGVNTIVQNGDALGYYSFHGADGVKFVQGAQIAARVDGVPAVDNMPGALQFATNPGGAAPVERMRITAAGNVGIGTTSPTSLLELNSTSAYASGWFKTLKMSNVASLIDNGTTGVGLHTDGSTYFLSSTLADFTSVGWVPSTVMKVAGNGRVGIGTTSPAARLEVSDTNVTGDADLLLRDSTGTVSAMRLVSYNGSNFIQSALNLNAGSAADLHIGSMLDNDRWMTIKANGNVGIGTSSPSLNSAGKMLHIHEPSASSSAVHFTNASTGQAGSTGFMVGRWNDGNAYVYSYEANNIYLGTNGAVRAIVGSNGSFYPGADNASNLGQAGSRWAAVYAANGTIQTSDRRMKRDIVPSKLGLNFLDELQPVTFRWKSGEFKDKTNYGFIAQDLEAELRSAGADEKNGIINYDEATDTYAVNYSQLIAPVVTAIQELYARLRGQEKIVDRFRQDEFHSLKAAAEAVARLRGLEIHWRTLDELDLDAVVRDIEATLPDLVRVDPRDGRKSIVQGELLAILVEALERQERSIAAERERNDRQDRELERIGKALQGR